MKRSFFALVLAAFLFTPVPSTGAESGRYVLKDVEGGFIRLDTETGAVAHCRAREGEWRCDTVADDRKALQDRIAALEKGNAELQHRIVELEAELIERPATGPRVDLPSDEELDRILGFFEKIMRRFVEFARSLQQDPGEKI